MDAQTLKQYGMDPSDVSPAYKPHPGDEAFALWMQQTNLKATPFEVVDNFKVVGPTMSDYGFWFFLGVLWNAYAYVKDSGIPLQMWLDLWNSSRRLRRLSVMKPYELERFDKMPAQIVAWRVRDDIEGWPAFVVEEAAARDLAQLVDCIPTPVNIYRTKDCKALFLRRRRYEVVIIDHKHIEAIAED